MIPVTSNISYQTLLNDFKLKDKRKISAWIKFAVTNEKKNPGEISIVCCSDDYLLEINKQYLNHNYFTDIITFDYTDNQVVSGDLMLSIDRIRDNAQKLGIDFIDELHRVIIHGVLHLCGFKDKKPEDKAKMTARENYYLKKRKDFLLI